jgi:DNA end-binding protein Ku
MGSTVWKGHIAFGMVSFPVKLHAAARSQTVSFHLLHKCDHSRVKQVLYCQAEDHPVPRSELVKGFEYDKDRYVVIEEQDLTRAEPRSARLMEVLQFVPAAQVDPVYLDASYYVVPEAAGQLPYTLLFQALRRSGYVAIAQWTAHNREHMVLLRPGRNGLILHTLYYQDEVRAEDEFHTDTAQIPARELELATLLVDALAAGFEPSQYRDRYRENLRALIEAKIQGQDIADGVAEPVRPPVLDIVRALETSLARAQKPVRVAHGGGAGPVDADTEICRRPRKRA